MLKLFSLECGSCLMWNFYDWGVTLEVITTSNFWIVNICIKIVNSVYFVVGGLTWCLLNILAFRLRNNGWSNNMPHQIFSLKHDFHWFSIFTVTGSTHRKFLKTTQWGSKAHVAHSSSL